MLEQSSVQEVLQLEAVLCQVELRAGDGHELRPVPLPHCPVRQRLEEGEQSLEVVDRGAAVTVRRPVAQRLQNQTVRPE